MILLVKAKIILMVYLVHCCFHCTFIHAYEGHDGTEHQPSYSEEDFMFVNVRDAVISPPPKFSSTRLEKSIHDDHKTDLKKIREELEEHDHCSLNYVLVSREIEAAMRYYGSTIKALHNHLVEAERQSPTVNQELFRGKLDDMLQCSGAFEQIGESIEGKYVSGNSSTDYPRTAQALFRKLCDHKLYEKVYPKGGTYVDSVRVLGVKDSDWHQISDEIDKQLEILNKAYRKVLELLEQSKLELPQLPKKFINVTGEISTKIEEYDSDDSPLVRRNINEYNKEDAYEGYNKILHEIRKVLLAGAEALLEALVDSSESVKYNYKELQASLPIALSGAISIEKGISNFMGRVDYKDGSRSEWKYTKNCRDKEWVYDVKTFKCRKEHEIQPGTEYSLWQSTFDISATEKPCDVLYTTNLGILNRVRFDSRFNPALRFMEQQTNNHLSGSLFSGTHGIDSMDRMYFLDKQKNQAKVCAVDGLAHYDGHGELNYFCGPLLDSCASVSGTFANCAKDNRVLAVALTNGAIAFVCSHSLRPLPYMIAPRCLHCKERASRPILIRWCCSSNSLFVLYEKSSGGTFINIYDLPCDPQNLRADITKPCATIKLNSILTFLLCRDKGLIYVLTTRFHEEDKDDDCSMLYAYSWTKDGKLDGCSESSHDCLDERIPRDDRNKLKLVTKARLPYIALFMELYPVHQYQDNDEKQTRDVKSTVCLPCYCPIVIYSKIWDKNKHRDSGLLQLIELIKNPDPV